MYVLGVQIHVVMHLLCNLFSTGHGTTTIPGNKENNVFTDGKVSERLVSFVKFQESSV